MVTGFAERGTFKQTTERLLSYSLDDLENQESGHAEKQEADTSARRLNFLFLRSSSLKIDSFHGTLGSFMFAFLPSLK